MEVVNIKDNEVVEIVHWIDSGCDNCDVVFNVGANATLRYVEVACSKGVRSSKVVFNCDRDSKLFVNTLDVDNVELKREQTYNLNDKGVEVDVVGLYIVNKEEECDNVLKMNHLHPNCTSKQNYRGVVGNVAHFNGHIYIAKDAQQTVALQENHNLLLNDRAQIFTQPWLEIYADDVKCNHGATCGKNNDDAIFYMRQRGISLDESKKILLRGYIEQCIMDCKDKEAILEVVDKKISSL